MARCFRRGSQSAHFCCILCAQDDRETVPHAVELRVDAAHAGAELVAVDGDRAARPQLQGRQRQHAGAGAVIENRVTLQRQRLQPSRRGDPKA